MEATSRQSNTLIVSFISVLMLMSILSSHQVIAAPPVAFDNWRADNGIIDTSASCTGNIQCTTLAEEDGFLQQEVVTPKGSFIRLIMTETGSTGSATELAFTDENFVLTDRAAREAGPSTWNIDLKQSIRDPANGLNSTTQIERHPYIDNNNMAAELIDITIDQSITSVDVNNQLHFEKHETILYEGAIPVESIKGQSIDISSNVQMASSNDPFSDAIGFEYRQRGGVDGSFNNGAFTHTPITTTSSLTLDGKTVDWNEGDTISASLISTTDSNSDIIFAYQTIENKDAPEAIDPFASQLAMNNPAIIDPFNWDNNLGATPTF